MNKIILGLGTILLMSSCGADAPQIDVPKPDQDSSVVMDDHTEFKDDIAAYKTVVNVIRETGLAQNFIILPGDVKQVVAYIENDERILKYNPDFMKTIETDTTWHGISILATQIGHHLSHHELAGGKPNIEEELEADKYAGFVLQKMGASLEEAIAAIEHSAKEKENISAASLNARIAALTQGWSNSKALSSDTIVNAIVDKPDTVKVKAQDSNPVKSSFQPEYVFKIFLAIDTNFYFIDDHNVVFSEQKGKPEKVGIKRESYKPGFDWIFTKGEDSYGVDRNGRLWAFSSDGKFHIVGQAVKIEK